MSKGDGIHLKTVLLLFLFLLYTSSVVLYSRIKIRKACLLHVKEHDEETKKKAEQAETTLSLGKCHEGKVILHNAKANIILFARKMLKQIVSVSCFIWINAPSPAKELPLTKVSPLCKRDYERVLLIWDITKMGY